MLQGSLINEVSAISSNDGIDLAYPQVELFSASLQLWIAFSTARGKRAG